MRASILIPSKDRPEKLEQAVRFALDSIHTQVEVVVMDGSTSTLEPVLPNDPRLIYVREPDDGIAHALNRAAAIATGDVLHYACDDDQMRSDAAASAVAAISQGWTWTYGAIEIVTLTEYGTHAFHSMNGGWAWEDGDRLRRENYVPQPATWFSREAFDRAGGYDESIRWCVDYELLGRFAVNREHPLVRAHVDSTYVQWPGSTSVGIPHLMIEEADAIRIRWRDHGLGWRHDDRQLLS